MSRRIASQTKACLPGALILICGAVLAWWLYSAPARSLTRAGWIFMAAGVAGLVFVVGTVVGRIAPRSGTGEGGPGGGAGGPRPEEPPPSDIDAEFWRIVEGESMSRP